MRDALPDWLVLYAALGMCDLAFTLVAFQLGAGEANPFLALQHKAGLFVFAKLCTTLLVLCICFRLRHRPAIYSIMSVANVVMASLVVYHVASLCALFG